MSAGEGGDLQASLSDEGEGGFVGAEETMGGEQREHSVAGHRPKGDADGSRRPLAEAVEDAALLAPRHLLVAIVSQERQLCRHRPGGEDQIREHLPTPGICCDCNNARRNRKLLRRCMGEDRL